MASSGRSTNGIAVATPDNVYRHALAGLPADPRDWHWAEIKQWMTQLGQWTAPYLELMRAQRDRGADSIRLEGSDLLLFEGTDDDFVVWPINNKQDRTRFKAAVQQVKTISSNTVLQDANVVLRRLESQVAVEKNRALPTDLSLFSPMHTYLWLKKEGDAIGLGPLRDRLIVLELRGPFLLKLCSRASSSIVTEAGKRQQAAATESARRHLRAEVNDPVCTERLFEIFYVALDALYDQLGREAARERTIKYKVEEDRRKQEEVHLQPQIPEQDIDRGRKKIGRGQFSTVYRIKLGMRDAVAKKLGHEEEEEAENKLEAVATGAASPAAASSVPPIPLQPFAVVPAPAPDSFQDVTHLFTRDQCLAYVRQIVSGQSPNVVATIARDAGVAEALVGRVLQSAANIRAQLSAPGPTVSFSNAPMGFNPMPPSGMYLSAAPAPSPPTKAVDSIKLAERAAALRQEALLLKASQGPGVLKYIGSNLDKGWLVTEFMARGDLEQELQLSLTSEKSLFHPNHPYNLGAARAGVQDPVMYQVVRAAREIAIGVQTIHSVGIVHQDLAPRNVFLDASLHWKVGDFGLAARESDLLESHEVEIAIDRELEDKKRDGAPVPDEELPHYRRLRRSDLGLVMARAGRKLKHTHDPDALRPLKAMSPLCWAGGAHDASFADRSTDVYSFGCVLLELVTKRPPHHDLVDIEAFKAEKAAGRGDAVIPGGVMPEYAAIIRRCWCIVAPLPTIQEILGLLNALHIKLGTQRGGDGALLASYSSKLLSAPLMLTAAAEDVKPGGTLPTIPDTESDSFSSADVASPSRIVVSDAYMVPGVGPVAVSPALDPAYDQWDRGLPVGVKQQREYLASMFHQAKLDAQDGLRGCGVLPQLGDMHLSLDQQTAEFAQAITTASSRRDHAQLIDLAQVVPVTQTEVPVMSRVLAELRDVNSDVHSDAHTDRKTQCLLLVHLCYEWHSYPSVLQSLLLLLNGLLGDSGADMWDLGEVKVLEPQLISVLTACMQRYPREEELQLVCAQTVRKCIRLTEQSSERLKEASGVTALLAAMHTFRHNPTLVSAVVHALGAFRASDLLEAAEPVCLQLLQHFERLVPVDSNAAADFNSDAKVTSPSSTSSTGKKGVIVNKHPLLTLQERVITDEDRILLEGVVSALWQVCAEEPNAGAIRSFLGFTGTSSGYVTMARLHLLLSFLHRHADDVSCFAVLEGIIGFLSCLLRPSVDIDGAQLCAFRELQDSYETILRIMENFRSTSYSVSTTLNTKRLGSVQEALDAIKPGFASMENLRDFLQESKSAEDLQISCIQLLGHLFEYRGRARVARDVQDALVQTRGTGLIQRALLDFGANTTLCKAGCRAFARMAHEHEGQQRQLLNNNVLRYVFDNLRIHLSQWPVAEAVVEALAALLSRDPNAEAVPLPGQEAIITEQQKRLAAMPGQQVANVPQAAWRIKLDVMVQAIEDANRGPSAQGPQRTKPAPPTPQPVAPSSPIRIQYELFACEKLAQLCADPYERQMKLLMSICAEHGTQPECQMLLVVSFSFLVHLADCNKRFFAKWCTYGMVPSKKLAGGLLAARSSHKSGFSTHVDAYMTTLIQQNMQLDRVNDANELTLIEFVLLLFSFHVEHASVVEHALALLHAAVTLFDKGGPEALQVGVPASRRAQLFDASIIEQTLKAMRLHPSSSAVCRHGLLLLLSLTREVQTVSDVTSDHPSFTEVAQKSATDISVADGVEITIQALEKHPTDRILQSAAIHLLLSLHAHKKLANRVGEKLVKLRQLATAASQRGKEGYMATSLSRRLPVKEYAIRLLNVCDALIGDKGSGLVRPVALKIVSTFEHAIEDKKKFTQYDMRCDWDGEEIKWKLTKRYSEFLQLHEKLRHLFVLAPFPGKIMKMSAADLEQRRTALQLWLSSIIDQPEARRSIMFLEFIGAMKRVPAEAKELVPAEMQTIGVPYGHGGKTLAFDEASGLLAVGSQYLKQVSFFSTVLDRGNMKVPKGSLQILRLAPSMQADALASSSSLFSSSSSSSGALPLVSCLIQPFTSEVTAVCIISEWRCIAVGLFTGAVLVFAYSTAAGGAMQIELKRVISAHTSEIQGIVFDSTTNMMISSSEKGCLAVFDMSEGHISCTVFASAKVCSMVYDRAHRICMLGTTASTVKVYDVAQVPPKLVHTIAVTQLVDGPRPAGAPPSSPAPKVPAAVGDIKSLAFDGGQMQLYAQAKDCSTIFQLDVERSESLDRSIAGNVTVTSDQLLKAPLHQQFEIRSAEFHTSRQQLILSGYNGAVTMLDMSNVSKPRVISAWRTPAEVVTWTQWIDSRCLLVTTGKDRLTHLVSVAHFRGYHVESSFQEEQTKADEPARTAAWITTDDDDDDVQSSAVTQSKQQHLISPEDVKLPAYIKKSDSSSPKEDGEKSFKSDAK